MTTVSYWQLTICIPDYTRDKKYLRLKFKSLEGLIFFYIFPGIVIEIIFHGSFNLLRRNELKNLKIYFLIPLFFPSNYDPTHHKVTTQNQLWLMSSIDTRPEDMYNFIFIFFFVLYSRVYYEIISRMIACVQN